MTVGILINPRAGKGNGKGLALQQKLGDAPHATVRLLNTFSDISAYMEEFAQLNVEDIYISSGDGTIQEVQTILAERGLFKKTPRLCLLPHGTTNMTAATIGFLNRDIAAQAAFIRKQHATDTVKRNSLRAVNPRDGKPRHGMFLGAGAVTQATKFCQDAVHRSGLKGEFATFATLAASALRAMATKANPNDLTRIDRPHHISLSIDGKPRAGGEQLLLLLSTLDKLILGARPFWGGKTGPIRGSLFPYPLPSVVRWLIPLMYGSEQRKVPQGAISFSCTSCEIWTPSTFILDGEFFEPPESGPLRVEAGPEITYIRG